VLDVVSGHRPGDSYCAPPPARPFLAEVGADPGRLRIGLLTADPAGRSTVDPDCAAGARAVADALAELGHDVADGFPPALADGPPEQFGTVMAVVATRALELWGERLGRPLTEADVEPGTWGASRYGESVTGTQYTAGVDGLRARAQAIERWWEEDGWDLLLTPTMPVKPPPLDQPLEGDPMTFTVPFNVSGQPAVSLPLHTDAGGLPVGVQLVAAYGREDVLLRVASQLEVAIPWTDRRPAVSA
jgi:Asp-tRNA(Asn)/Glu-tRNA(Gln) amidotransferase A subunit family amidase